MDGLCDTAFQTASVTVFLKVCTQNSFKAADREDAASQNTQVRLDHNTKFSEGPQKITASTNNRKESRELCPHFLKMGYRYLLPFVGGLQVVIGNNQAKIEQRRLDSRSFSFIFF